MQIVSRRPDYIPAGPSSFIIGSALPWRTFDIGWWHSKAVLAFDPLNARYMRGGSEVSLTAQVSTVRSSSHLLTSTAGLLQSFGVNTLAAIKDKGAYIGGQATNLLSRTQEFGDGYWTKAASSISSNSDTAPDGTVTADRLVENSASSQHEFYRGSFSIVNGAPYTWSVYAKPAERNWLLVNANGGGGDKYTFFNLSGAGSVGTNASGSTARISALANGWYRCEVTRIAEGSSGICAFKLAAGDGANSYQGNGSSGMALWGAQLEASGFATPYIPTTTSSAVRFASAVSAVNDGSDPFAGFNGNGLSYGVSALAAVKLSHIGDGTIRPLMELSDGSISNRLCLYIDTDDKPVASVISGGSTIASVKLASALTAARIVLAVNYDPADGLYLIRKTGLEEASTSLSGMPSGLSKLAMGSNVSSAYFNDLIEQIQITRRLTRSEASTWVQAA